MTEKREIIKPFRMTRKEAALLKQEATERNLSESGYLRLLLSQKPNDFPEIRQLLHDLTNEINAIGININQIAKNNNSRIYHVSDKELLAAYMKKLNLMVKEVRDKIGNQ